MIPTVITLIVSNVIPLVSYLLFDLSVPDIFLAYIFESLIIAIFGIIKIIRKLSFGFKNLSDGHGKKSTVIAEGIGGFLFMFAYSIGSVWMIYTLANLFIGNSQQDLFSLAKINLLGIVPSVIAITGHHAYSFFVNFIRKSEYVTYTLSDALQSVFLRMITFVMGVMFGLIISSKEGVIVRADIESHFLTVLCVFILVKTIIDIWLHVQSHKAKSFIGYEVAKN